jgi:glycine amidinotransferase
LTSSVVYSCNEWDPLEEVVLGSATEARMPWLHPAVAAALPATVALMAGLGFPRTVLLEAERELDRFAEFLVSEGIVVRHPDEVDHAAAYATPWWGAPHGLYSAMPRDVALVYEDEIIEAPMAWRSRYFEAAAFRRLFREYFDRGARWTAAPKPLLKDATFEVETAEEDWSINESEVLFDAADFVRCGSFIVGQRSHVTNRGGFEWLRRHLGGRVPVVELGIDDPHAMHLDTTIVPLREGTALVNRSRVTDLTPAFADWEVIDAPAPDATDGPELLMSSAWVSTNILSLDPERVVVEESQASLRAVLEAHGFEVMPLPFKNFNVLGGSFHCATLDIRRAR